MTSLEIFSMLFGFLALAMIGGSVALWVLAGTRLSNKQSVIPLVGRPPVPWSIDGFLIGVGLMIVLGNFGLVIARSAGWITIPEEIQATPFALADMATMLTIEGATRVIALFGLIAWLVVVHRSTLIDLGLRICRTNIMWGVIGTVALLPPIYALQAVLTIFWMEYEHPVLQLLQESGDLRYLLPMAMIAVVVAPITEEFLFRVVLQGWLQSLGQSIHRRIPVPTNEAYANSESKSSNPDETDEFACDSSETEPTQLPYWPILVSSVLFALAHFGHGPAPVTLFFLALGLGYLYRQTHSIWPSLIVHIAMNAITMIVAAVSLMVGQPLT